jgi:hypothetical protein
MKSTPLSREHLALLRIFAVAAILLMPTTLRAADPDPSQAAPDPSQAGVSSAPAATKGPIETFFDDWDQMVRTARATQPTWSSPVVTTTALLEQRLRFDFESQRAGNGAETQVIDNGKGLDLIVGPDSEVQLAAPAYEIRSTANGKNQFSGFNDWAFLRFKQRLASSPEDAGDYIVSAWVQLQAASGIAQLTNHVFTVLPTLGFGKGFGPFVVQGTVGGVVPTSDENTIGAQFAGNVAFQYHVWERLWPEIEVNWTHFIDGPRDGKDQVFLTPGLVVGRFALSERLRCTFGVGYQFAVEPHFQSSPLLPSYNHAWIVTTRFNF